VGVPASRESVGNTGLKSCGTLLAAMATVWNKLPEAIKSEQNKITMEENCHILQ
jgi:hypothetical protein